MEHVTLRFERDYELPRVIVWDALVDPDLVSGWLAEARITAEVGGEYNLRWSHRIGQPDSPGRITVLMAPDLLDIDTANVGRIRFELQELEGGSRGASTRLRVTVELEIEPVFTPRVRADWLTNLDQLEDLLRGHPVDWTTWDQDRHDSWSRHLDSIENTPS